MPTTFSNDNLLIDTTTPNRESILNPTGRRVAVSDLMLYSMKGASHIYQFLSQLKYGFSSPEAILKDFMYYRKMLSTLFNEYHMHIIREDICDSLSSTALYSKINGVVSYEPGLGTVLTAERRQKRSSLCDTCSSSLLCYADIGIHKITRCVRCGKKLLYASGEVLPGDDNQCPKSSPMLECHFCAYINVDKVTAGMTKWLEKEVANNRSFDGVSAYLLNHAPASFQGLDTAATGDVVSGDVSIDYENTQTAATYSLVIQKFIELITKARQPAVLSPWDFDIFSPKVISEDDKITLSGKWKKIVDEIRWDPRARIIVNNASLKCVINPTSNPVSVGSGVHEVLMNFLPDTEEQCRESAAKKADEDTCAVITDALFGVKGSKQENS